MLKKFFLCVIIISFSQLLHASSQTLINSYKDLLNAVSQGDEVRAIIFVNKCSMTKSSLHSEDAIAGLNFGIFNKHKVTVGNLQKDTIATSMSTLIEHHTLGTVYNYVRLRVFDDNTADIFSEYLDPQTYKKLGSMTLNCVVSNGQEHNGILLYHA